MFRLFFLICISQFSLIYSSSLSINTELKEKESNISFGDLGFSFIKTESLENVTKSVVDIDCEPSSIVCGCVNVISGAFCDFESDLTIIGPEILKVERSYCSKDLSGTLCKGWSLNHYGFNSLSKPEEAKYWRIISVDEFGSQTLYEDKEARKEKEVKKFYVSKEFTKTGVTNTNTNIISGRTNIRNQFIEYNKKENNCIIYYGSGRKRYFKGEKDHLVQYLREQVEPNGNKFVYSYNKNNYIFQISAVNKNYLPFATIVYKGVKDDDINSLTLRSTTDGRYVKYFFDKIKGYDDKKFYILKEVERSNGLKLNYEYFDKKSSLIKKKSYPDNRYIDIDYYWEGENHYHNKIINIKHNDKAYHCVKSISQPVGSDATPIRTFSFLYKKNRVKVLDAYLHKIEYDFTEQKRLTSIKKFKGITGSTEFYSEERLYWADDTSHDRTNLMNRTFGDSNGNLFFSRSFIYDSKGNVLVDKLYGIHTGTNEILPQVDNGGNPIDNGCEVYEKRYSYSCGAYNLTLSEEDGKKRIAYTYHPNSNLLASKLIYEGNKLQIREFFKYDDNAVLISQVIDDGIGLNFEDLTGVTERKIRVIQPRSTFPIGLPEIEWEKFLNLNSGFEEVIKITRNYYSLEGNLLQKDIYDNKNQKIYSHSYQYDKLGNIVLEIDALGNTTERKYDSNGNKIFEQGPNKTYYIIYSYDFSNRLIREEEIHNNGQRLVTSHRYDYKNNRILSIDIYGNETKYIYDEFGRLIKTIFPNIVSKKGELINPEQSTIYNHLSQAIETIDANGGITKQTYTLRGKPILITSPDGTTQKNEYNLDGTLRRTIDSQGVVTYYEFDYQDRLTKKECFSPEGKLLYLIQKNYNAFHLLSEIDEAGIITNYKYNFAGQLIQKTKQKSRTLYEYDSLGRLHKVLDYFNSNDYSSKITEYDLLDRIIEERVEDNQGKILRLVNYEYDLDGNRTKVIQNIENRIQITHTEFNNHKMPICQIDALGNKTITTYRYDYINEFGQNVPYSETTDSSGVITITISDAMGHEAKIQKKDPLNKSIQETNFIYDVCGNLLQMEEKIIGRVEETKSVFTVWEYDSMDRPIKCIEADGSAIQKVTTTTYGPNGKKEKITKPNGVLLLYSYDELGRTNSLKASDDSLNYYYTYDINGNLLETYDFIQSCSTNKTYDENNRILEEKLNNGLILKYEYDLLGRVTKFYLPDNSFVQYIYDATDLREVRRNEYKHQYLEYDLSGNLLTSKLINDKTINFKYNPLGQVSSLFSQDWRQEVEYDSLGNILRWKILEEEGKASYDYLSQVIEEKGKFSNQYKMDSLYNRIAKNGQKHVVNELNQLLNDDIYEYSYDKNGNIASISEKLTCTYDALDRLMKVVLENKKIHYTYDENDRRMKKTVFRKENDQWTYEYEERYIYQGLNEIGKMNQKNDILELRILGTGKGAEIGAAVALEIDNKIFTPIHDLQGNLRCLLDDLGNIIEKYDYSVFGEENIKENSLSPWRYSSKRVDDETGWVYFGRRYYDQFTGRWTTQDPIGVEGGTNLYAFVMNNPLRFVDHYGLRPGVMPGIFGPVIDFCGSVCGTAGACLSVIGEHFIPVPIVRDVFSLAGHVLSENRAQPYVPSYKQQKSINFNNHDGEIYDNWRIVTSFGINTALSEHEEFSRKIAQGFGDNNIYNIYGATHGFIPDLFSCAAILLGFRTHLVDKEVEGLRCKIKELGGVGKGGIIDLICHSRGGLVAWAALKQLTPEERNMINVHTFGSAKLIPSGMAKTVTNYVNTGDFLVPFAGSPITYLKACLYGVDNIKFMPSEWNCVSAHLITHENYIRVIKEIGYNFVKGSL